MVMMLSNSGEANNPNSEPPIEVSHFPVPLPLIFWSRYILMSLTAHVPT